MSTGVTLQIKLGTTLSLPPGRKMYAIYSNKGISSSGSDRRQVLKSRSSRPRRGPTTIHFNTKNKSSSTVLLPPYSYTTTSSSASSSSNTNNKKKNSNPTNTTNNNEERQLQIAVDDLLQEHQDDIQRPKPRCTIHHRDSFSTISTRASILTSSQHHCQVKGEKRCGEFIIPTEISFSSSSLPLHSVATSTEVDSNNISLGSNHSNDSNNSKIKKSSKHLPDFPDSNVLIFDLYEDDDDDIMFIPPVVVEKDLITASTIRSREVRMRKTKRIVKRRESMGIINSAPAPSLPLRRKEMEQLSIGISRFEI